MVIVRLALSMALRLNVDFDIGPSKKKKIQKISKDLVRWIYINLKHGPMLFESGILCGR